MSENGNITRRSMADRVDVQNIQFARTTTIRTERAIVSFASSTGTLYFNPKMVNLLHIAHWQQVVVGYDKANDILILKECDAEEFGCVLVRRGQKFKTKPQNDERASQCRLIRIAHLLKGQQLQAHRAYRAEKNGNMVFLEKCEGS